MRFGELSVNRGVGRRSDLRKLYVVVLVFVMVFVFSFLVQRFRSNEDAEAASLAGFDPGYIISDYQMSNYNSMSEAEIQAFLTSKNSCGNRDYSYYVALSRNANYRWHFENGHFICLSEERFGYNDNEIGFQYGETAAHIIWQTAQDYRINPQVLLVLLQKETGLITDPIPNNGDYRKATGYGCPDTAACSSKYYGFRNQIRNAASLFRTVLDGGWTNYPLGNNYIQYNPNAACGGSVVNVRSLATSALYRYTPYQPNAGALAAGYGTASCGAYGNRNFYLYFEDWFGGITTEGVILPKSDDVIEGEYIIKSTLDNNMVVDVAGGRDADGVNIRLWENNGMTAQMWKIESDGAGSYTIKNATTGKALDVAGAGTSNGTNVQTYTYNGSCAQRWRIVRNSNGSFTFYSVCSGRVLDVAGANSSLGTNIQIYQPNDLDAQKWNLVPVQNVANGRYVISSGLVISKAIDIAGGATNAKNGTNIQLYEKNSTDAQKWNVIYGSDGYYTIQNMATGKYLEVNGSQTHNGANVQLYNSNGSCAQKWQIVKNNDGYILYSACSGKALDVAGARTTNGTNIQIYMKNGCVAQKWYFETAPDLSEGNYVIHSALNKDRVLDVAAASKVDGANVWLWEDNGNIAQKWQISSDGNGAYIITSLLSRKALDVAGALTNNGANVQQYVLNWSCAQRWRVIWNDDGTYTFYSVCSNKVLDVAGMNDKTGTNVQIYDYNGTSAQRWKLVGV